MSDGTGIEWTDATWNPTPARRLPGAGVTTSQKPDSTAPEMTSSDVASGRVEL